MSSARIPPYEATPARLIRSINELDSRVLDQHFVGTGIATPTHCWEPSDDAIPTHELRVLLNYWRGLRAGGQLPRQALFDVLAIPNVLGFLMLMDVVGGGEDFFYRVYGTRIAQDTGFDMTGKYLSHVPTVTSLAAYFMASYRAVVQRRAPLLTFHQPPPGQPIRGWARLILPMADAEDNVSRLLVGNMPDPAARIT